MNALSKLLFLTSCYLILSAFAPPKGKILGKWHYSDSKEDYSVYLKTSKSYSRTFEFKRGGKATFSHCTDMCGCDRRTNFGNWKWVNDTSIVINYHHYTQQFGSSKKRPLRKPFKQHLIIKKVNNKALEMNVKTIRD